MTKTDAMKFLESVRDNNTLACIRWGKIGSDGITTWNKKFIVMSSPGEHYEWLSRKPTIDLEKKTLKIEAVDCEFDLNKLIVLVGGFGGIISLQCGDYCLEIDTNKGEDWCDICCRR